jgi:hypothetical protein
MGELLDMMEKFTQRKLTYDDDILNAFAGIANYLEVRFG